MKRRELLWMILPCLFFVAAAFWMGARENLGLATSFNRPFQLYIENVEILIATPKDAAAGYDTQVVVVLNHMGRAPDWWGKASNNYASPDRNAHLFYEAEGKKSMAKLPPRYEKEPDIYYWRPSWKSETGRYEARFLLQLAKLPRRSEKTVLRADIAVEDPNKTVVNGVATFLSEKVPLEFTVREAHQVFTLPEIPQDTGLEVGAITIKKASAAEQGVNGGFDTEVSIALTDTNPDETEKGSAFGTDALLNEQGQSVPNSGPWRSPDLGFAGQNRHTLTYYVSLKTTPAKEKNIILKTNFSRNDQWPLQLYIPLRRKGKDLTGVVQALPPLKQNRAD